MLDRVEHLTCDRGNFNQIAGRSRNLTPVTVARDMHNHCTTNTPFQNSLQNNVAKCYGGYRVNILHILQQIERIRFQEIVL